MVQQIDFLPTCYWQMRHRRKKKVWRQAVLVVFLSMIVVGTLQQRHIRANLEAKRTRIQNQANQMTAHLENADALRQQIHQLDAKANLVANLRVAVRPTRILATVTNSRPEYVTLTELHMSYDDLAKKTPAKSRSQASQDGQDASTNELAEELDLKERAKTRGQTALFVDLKGIAPDNVAISSYLDALEQSGLFDEVEWINTDEYDDPNEYQLRSFEFHLRVKKPGDKSLDDQPIEKKAGSGGQTASIDDPAIGPSAQRRRDLR